MPADRSEWAALAAALLVAVVGGAAFPRLSYLLRWPTRLGPRGLLAYVAGRTAFTFWLLQYVRPWAKARAAEVDALRAELTDRLGRAPTEQELLDVALERHGADADDPRRVALPFGRGLRWWPGVDADAGSPPTAP